MDSKTGFCNLGDILGSSGEILTNADAHRPWYILVKSFFWIFTSQNQTEKERWLSLKEKLYNVLNVFKRDKGTRKIQHLPTSIDQLIDRYVYSWSFPCSLQCAGGKLNKNFGSQVRGAADGKGLAWGILPESKIWVHISRVQFWKIL